MYSKLKTRYEEQQKDKIKPIHNTTHHSNAGTKTVVIEDEILDDYRNCSMRKLKQSQDFVKLMKGSKLSLDTNSNNSNEERPTSENSLTLNSKTLSESQKNVADKSMINPFGNSKEISHGSNGNNLILNTIQNSPFKTGGKSPNRAPTTTLNSNFFLKEMSAHQEGLNILPIKVLENNNKLQPLVSPSESSRRFSSFLNKHINLDLVKFEFIRSFTNLSLKDLIKEDIIYSADICNVYKGKYLSLPVAIKVYNIAKLREDDLVL